MVHEIHIYYIEQQMASALGVGARGRQLSEGAQRCAGGFESGQPQTMLPKHLKLNVV